MRTLTLLVFLVGLASCETIDKSQAIAVKQVNGLYIYVLSEPRMQVEPLGEVHNDQLYEATSENNKLAHIIKGTTATEKNVDFQHVLRNMTVLAKEQHPDAEALIFDNNLRHARVVKFRLPYPSSY
ncbi:hypothetical protein JMN32_22880 [Fulvivirga sp. 29W222]|uniref:Uncharacterized protein n=1 Tax=Fulvivirga marina TaxID=2494733 RepID=A0A937G382_9BACT|nr:hypothetical protein [Fulvivirga marina]MBL6449175.1 hypothetical protein [Fulvivirga marina]